MRIDFMGRVLRTAVLIDFEARVADADDVSDAITLDDDIDRANRRCAGTIDECRAADNQSLVRAFALAAIRRRNHAWPRVFLRERCRERNEQYENGGKTPQRQFGQRTIPPESRRVTRSA